MSLLMPPAHVPIGWVTVGGVRLPVFINPPWQRTFGDVPAAIASAVPEAPVVVFGDLGEEGVPMIIPGPQGEPGKETVSYVLLIEETPENYFFIPMG